MKLEGINIYKERNLNFNGLRADRNTVAQLSQNNRYSLTEPNQRRISEAIENLSKVKGIKNVKFLLDTAAKNKYSTNIPLPNLPKNNWKSKLLTAAVSAAAITAAVLPKGLTNKIKQLEKTHKPNVDEREILDLREQLLEVVDLEQIKRETKGSTKNFKNNLDSFIVSSETTLEHKKYVLTALNYFMSDKYEINPQLKDKKSIAVAEMVNDMAICATGADVPNIKAVNQKQHGMCAAISIVRKKLAYEDKPNYVDSILSELDASDEILVYDRNNLGSGKKIAVSKVPVDFTTALSKGYRIIDAATMYWMQIADMNGASNISFNEYSPFDKENFDVKTDSFLNSKFEDPELASAQNYYQALILAKSLIENYKADKIKKSVKQKEFLDNSEINTNTLANTIQELKSALKKILPENKTKELQPLTAEIIKLEHKHSNQIKPGDKFAYIPNEEDSVKTEKIKNYIINKTGIEKIDDKTAKTIFELTEFYHSTLNDSSVDKPRSALIKKAQSLYNIAAAFRYQVIKGLEEETTLNNVIRNENLHSREELLLKQISNLINKLKNNSPQSESIIKQISPFFDLYNPTNEEMVTALEEYKDLVNKCLTKELDTIFEELGLGDRKQNLISYIENCANEIENGNSSFVKGFAQILDVKESPKSVTKALYGLIGRLEDGDEKTYDEIFYKLRNTSPIDNAKATYQYISDKLFKQKDKETFISIIEANNFKPETTPEQIEALFDYIDKKFDKINKFLTIAAKSLTIKDKNGHILSTAIPTEAIIKKLENENRIASSSALEKLQEHFAKIAQDSSKDEFQSRQGKLSDKSLYEFSPEEKAVLKETEDSINVMYTYIQKQLNYVRRDLKDALESLKHTVGINNGQWWVREGESGLNTEQQIRILEYMTGRPHYKTDDLKKAFEKIKTGPYSGISSSSVYHDQHGWHAQYIADIEPVKVNVKDKDGNIKQETKDVLFQDNSWGASEQENTWTDSYGLTRTDYSDNRGGTQGYITNGKYRNGNFVERILGDMVLKVKPQKINSKMYKRLKRSDNDSYKSPQYRDVILDGKSPELKTVSSQIHDAFFASNAMYLGELQKLIGEDTSEKIKSLITKIKNSGKTWEKTYEELKQRIFPEIGKSIETEEDYNNLADNDYLKVVMEKIALKNSAKLASSETALAKVRNVKDLNKFKSAQRTKALKDFKYAFTKNQTIVDYLADSFGEEQDKQLQAILDKYHVVITDKEYNSIGSNFSVDMDKFDGSAKTTVNLIMQNINKDIKKVISDKDAQTAVSKFFRDYLKEKIYFNKSDLDLSELDNQQIEHIIKFIDREFNPADDEEFVKIYRKIQDMTTEEFKKEILPRVTPEDMGIKQITGFDVLKKIQRYEEKINTTLLNTVYFDTVSQELNSKDYTIDYSNKKFFRTPKFKLPHTFNDMYKDLNYSLSLLNYRKLFNKYKEQYLKKYEVYPAYPEVNSLSEEYLKEYFDKIINTLNENTDMVKITNSQIENYEINHQLKTFVNEMNDSSVITGKHYDNLISMLQKLVKINAGDDSVQIIVNSALQALKLPEGTSLTQFKPYLDTIIQNIEEFEKTTPIDILNNIIEDKKKEIKVNKQAFVNLFVQPKYRSRMAHSLNELTESFAKDKVAETERLKAEFFNNLKKYHVLNDTEELLNVYLESCAKDSKYKAYTENYKNLLLRALNFAKLAEVQEIIMDAVGNGVALNAKSRFNQEDNLQAPMGSSEMIAEMTNQLILKDDYEVPLLFLEKFGLGEKYVEFMDEDFDYEQLKNIINESHKITVNFKEFQDTTEPYFNQVKEELNKDNADLTVLDNLQNIVQETGKNLEIDEEALKIIVGAIEVLKFNCINNKQASKPILYTAIIDKSKQSMAETLLNKVNEFNEILNANGIILDFMNQILLDENSKAKVARDHANQEFKELIEYQEYLNNLQDDENSDKI